MRRLLSLVPFLALAAILWYFHAPLLGFARIAESRYFPCEQPIPYALGSLDPRFKVSTDTVLAAVSDAEGLWEKAAGRDLFIYDPSNAPGDLTVNLVYDDRQQATDRLRELGIVIDGTEKSYNALDAKYKDEKASYDSEKAALDALVASFSARKSAYEAKVSYWNSRGGASGATYQTLETERRALTVMVNEIKVAQANLNTLGDNINSLVVVLNRIASDLNLTAQKYNTSGAGQEFEEGLYKSSAISREIDIYQFDNRSKLVRVLAHEMGHALGLEHNDDPQAIMYRLNQGQNDKLTAADVTGLKAMCGIK